MARRNVYTLTPTEWASFVQAMNALKANGKLDDMTRRHNTAMMSRTLYPGETGTSRNRGHRGPVFLPWHRQALRELTALLQAQVPGIEIPYWPWHRDGSGWQTAKIWSLVGGNGSSSSGSRVTTGPFSGWTSVIYNASTGGFVSRAGILRQFASGSMPSVAMASAPGVYDAAPWSENDSLTSSFRRWLENYHNQVHNLVRGDMISGTSPNDPIFWLHHCNVDRIWAAWQALHPQAIYLPKSGAPLGHNLNDPMLYLLTPNVTPEMVLDPDQYDTLVP